MRIDSFQYLNQCRTKQLQTGAAAGKAKGTAKRNCDTVSFSSAAQAKPEITDAQLMEMRAERVERIKQQVKAGSYSVSGRAVVEKMCQASTNIGHRVNENG
ncbi:MAG: flagellar biosynthesis anti-sigma factor FlgM [Peptococcaceae bacterium]|nr:flagellar biosynthesis anti-sigma factor FlgM [Peptococcaceae bacterium]